MKLEYVPLLRVQRNLYALPRGMERFQEYLRTMIDPATGDIALPLAGMNPMGKEHLPKFIDGLLALNADGAAAAATHRTGPKVAGDPGAFRVCCVVVDDLHGGWTNRYATEYAYRFDQGAYYKRGWIAAILWTSETYGAEQVGAEVAACIYRSAYVQRHGRARTLSDHLAQEAWVLSQAGVSEQALDAEDVEYTAHVLAPLLARTDQPTLTAALFGDEAARNLGYPPLGLSARAGLALARTRHSLPGA